MVLTKITVRSQHQQLISSHLSLEDDEDFWSNAISILLCDLEAELETARPKAEVYVQIGACSHWLRPHQTRWTAAGGFAYPSGYGSSGFSLLGLPNFDWSILLHRDAKNQNWQPVAKLTGKRHLIFRATLPTRTKRHGQAAVHTIWLPAHPSSGEQKATQFYGFRKIENVWQCVTNN